jgi:hypothetical protein
VLVVVDVVSRVAMGAVDVVDVVFVTDGLVTATLAVHMHVPDVRDVSLALGHVLVVDMVAVDAVGVAVVEVVDVVPVADRGMTAAGVVGVRMLLQRLVRLGFGHGHLRRHGSPSPSGFASTRAA